MVLDVSSGSRCGTKWLISQARKQRQEAESGQETGAHPQWPEDLPQASALKSPQCPCGAFLGTRPFTNGLLGDTHSDIALWVLNTIVCAHTCVHICTHAVTCTYKYECTCMYMHAYLTVHMLHTYVRTSICYFFEKISFYSPSLTWDKFFGDLSLSLQTQSSEGEDPRMSWVPA